MDSGAELLVTEVTTGSVKILGTVKKLGTNEEGKEPQKNTSSTKQCKLKVGLVETEFVLLYNGTIVEKQRSLWTVFFFTLKIMGLAGDFIQ